MIPTDPKKLCSYLAAAEVDGDRAADCRRVLRDERMRLTLALQSSDQTKIASARDEALRVARMWEGY